MNRLLRSYVEAATLAQWICRTLALQLQSINLASLQEETKKKERKEPPFCLCERVKADPSSTSQRSGRPGGKTQSGTDSRVCSGGSSPSNCIRLHGREEDVEVRAYFFSPLLIPRKLSRFSLTRSKKAAQKKFLPREKPRRQLRVG